MRCRDYPALHGVNGVDVAYSSQDNRGIHGITVPEFRKYLQISNDALGGSICDPVYWLFPDKKLYLVNDHGFVIYVLFLQINGFMVFFCYLHAKLKNLSGTCVMLIKLLYRLFPKLLFFIRICMRDNKDPEMKLLPVLCLDNMTSIDVGAKFGMYTYRLNRHSDRVIAFEPIAELNIALSKIFRKHTVDVMPLALSGISGIASMKTPLFKSGNPRYGRSSIEKENRIEFEGKSGWDEFTVNTARLDDLSIENIGFIKIDVEGHEQAVLAGGLLTIQKNKPAMLIEANDNHLPDAVGKLFAWAAGNSYLVFFMDDGKIFPSLKYNTALHHHQKSLENFILVHENDTERLQKIELSS